MVELFPWKHMVYTGPIDAFFHFKYGKLPYRSLEFQHQHQVLFNRQATENRGLLWQITNTRLSPLVDRQTGQHLIIQRYFAALRLDNADHGVERGGFPGTVWPQ